MIMFLFRLNCKLGRLAFQELGLFGCTVARLVVLRIFAKMDFTVSVFPRRQRRLVCGVSIEL
jgi:hypothetical protein